MATWKWFVVSVVLGSVGCGVFGDTDATIYAQDYGQACSVDDDCILVTEGAVCGCRDCYNASIAASSAAKWRDDLTRAQRPCSKDRTHCGSLELERRQQAALCREFAATCVEGMCAAVESESF